MERVTGVDGKHASPRSVLTGHVTGVECVSVSGDQGLVVSASRGSQVLLHRVTGEIVRKIRYGNNSDMNKYSYLDSILLDSILLCF